MTDSIKFSRRTDAVWVVSIISLLLVITTSIAITWWSSGTPHDNEAHAAHLHSAEQSSPSHNDFFTNHGLYMPRTHCLMTEAGNPDWLWIIILITLSLTIIAAYVKIYLFWCKSYFAEEPRDRNPRLMDLAQIFLWCAVCGYATSVLMFFWPAYRLVAVALLFLAFWSWRFCLNLSGFRAAFTADRYRRMVERDTLTNLLSRSAVLEAIALCVDNEDPEENKPTAVLFLDFDRFKLVNDSMGHEAGDELLKQIADRLTNAVNNQAFNDDIQYHIGRLGGDEFVIVVEGCDDTDRLEALAIRLHKALTHTYLINDRTVNSSASIGITSTAYDSTDSATLLRDADTAMYAAKRQGKGNTAWFNQAMHDAVKDAVEMEHQLKLAIDREELFLTYQPIIDLEDATVTGFEALIRWRHPERGLIRPDQFIPLAEDSLLIRPIGRWVIREALTQMKAWRQRFPELANGVMNVNLSRIQFPDRELVEFIIDTLDELGLPHEALCLEITESTIMQDSSHAIELLERFRALGIKLAMDDFGTGYSSLSYLHEFPLDTIKIDRAFIGNLSNNRNYAAVIHAISALADNLGFSVVAEGIETTDQLAELQALSCHKGQGYLFHKPAEPEIIEAYLSEREDKAASA
jgi:diguanylate cyclase (GGDEF)-like protein